MKKSKKALWISLISVEVVVTIFLFVVSIVMLATMPDSTTRKIIEQNGPKNFIQWFQIHPTEYLLIGVLPLFILLILNIVLLVRYMKKLAAKKKIAVSDLNDAEKEALRKELLKDLNQTNE